MHTHTSNLTRSWPHMSISNIWHDLGTACLSLRSDSGTPLVIWYVFQDTCICSQHLLQPQFHRQVIATCNLTNLVQEGQRCELKVSTQCQMHPQFSLYCRSGALGFTGDSQEYKSPPHSMLQHACHQDAQTLDLDFHSVPTAASLAKWAIFSVRC